MSEARERFRVPPGESPEWRDLRTRWLWGAALLVDYVQRSLPHSGLTPEEYGDVIHELYQQVARRTRFAGKYRALLEDADQWERLCDGLAALRRGEVIPKCS